ncbi:MAG TPA: diaminopimelate epimerase, partial [Acidimicrobiia bacterium]|nr:diaminopimelate epimerase [Acidimicrobiia bacterium]
MTALHFSKLHATGNDFLVLVDLEARFGSRGRNRLAPGLRAALCDRRRGVGADGLIRLLGGSDGADCEMELTNADGGLAEISGNGLRCLAHVAA